MSLHRGGAAIESKDTTSNEVNVECPTVKTRSHALDLENPRMYDPTKPYDKGQRKKLDAIQKLRI